MKKTNLQIFCEENVHFGNDIVELVKTYVAEILNIDDSKRSGVNETQLKTIFIAYPIALFSFVYASFNDEANGKKMMRDFNGEFLSLFESEKHAEGISKLVDAFRNKLINDANGIAQYAVDIYMASSSNKAKSEELTWVRNYVRAIHVIYSRYNEAAEKFGFIKNAN